MRIRQCNDVNCAPPSRHKKLIKKKLNLHSGFFFLTCLFKLRSKQLPLLPASFVIYGLTAGQVAIAAEKQMLQFDIKAQRADLALIEFAKQTEQTVIFSFELAKILERSLNNLLINKFFQEIWTLIIRI